MGETNSPSIAHVGYDISPLSRVKLKFLALLREEILCPTGNGRKIYIDIKFIAYDAFLE
jgi:hypothetical protein